MLGDSADADQNSGASASGDYVIRHWRSRAFAARDPSPRCSHSTDRPPALEIGRRSSPNGSGGGFDRFTWLENGTGYTSLRDLIESPSSPPIPSGARFPATPGARGGGEIRIKNRLVKQAAHAYLQPTPTSGSTAPDAAAAEPSDGPSPSSHVASPWSLSISASLSSAVSSGARGNTLNGVSDHKVNVIQMSLYLGHLSPNVQQEHLECVFRRFCQCNIHMKDDLLYTKLLQMHRELFEH